jgi:hypothetical protein
MKKFLVGMFLLAASTSYGQVLKGSDGSILAGFGGYKTSEQVVEFSTILILDAYKGNSFGSLGASSSKTIEYYFQCDKETGENFFQIGKMNHFFYNNEACETLMAEVIAHLRQKKRVVFTFKRNEANPKGWIQTIELKL